MQPPACSVFFFLFFTLSPRRVTSPRRLAAHLLREYCALPQKSKRAARDPDCPFTLMFRKLPACLPFDSPTCLSHSTAAVKASRAGDSLSLFFFRFFFFFALQLRHYRWHVEKRHSLSLVSHSPAAPARTRPLLVIAYSCHIYQTTNCISLLLLFVVLVTFLQKLCELPFATVRWSVRAGVLRLCFHPALTPTIFPLLFCFASCQNVDDVRGRRTVRSKQAAFSSSSSFLLSFTWFCLSTYAHAHTHKQSTTCFSIIISS